MEPEAHLVWGLGVQGLGFRGLGFMDLMRSKSPKVQGVRRQGLTFRASGLGWQKSIV